MRLELDVNGQKVEFVLDTGSQVSILKLSTWKLLKSALYKTDQVLLGAGGHPLDVRGKTVVSVKGNLSSATALAYIVAGAEDNLLGHDEIEQMGLLVLVNAVKSQPMSPRFACAVADTLLPNEAVTKVHSKPPF